MALFFEAKRNTDFPVQKGPSPSQYNTLRESKRTVGYAPFGSTAKLDRTMKKQQNSMLEFRNTQDDKEILFNQVTMKSLVQDQMAAVFKSRSERFINTYKDGPGPGAYQVKSKNTMKSQGKTKNQGNNSRLQIKHTTPSMPLDNLGYKYDKLDNAQKVKPKPGQHPKPGSYQLRKDLIKDHGLIWTDEKTRSKKIPEDPLPGPGQYTSMSQKAKAPSSCFDSKIDRFNQKSIRKTYKPGPGDYNPTEPKPFRQFSESHFNTKAMRFKPSLTSTVGPGSYHPEKSKSLKTFKSKHNEYRMNENKSTLEPNRKTIFSLHDKNPGPGQYIPRDGMTFELQKALLRKHNLSQFPNGKRQVFVGKDQEEPGPGAYNPEIPVSNPKGSLSGYKKVEVVNLKEQEDQPTPSPFDYTCQNYTIQKKVSDTGKKLTLTEKKPFDSGAQRFKHYSNKKQNRGRYQTHDTDDHSQEGGLYDQRTGLNFEESAFKKTKKLIMTSVKVKVPFGSSAPKYHDKQHEEPGPGAYSSKDSAWLKNTFNIKGKIKK